MGKKHSQVRQARQLEGGRSELLERIDSVDENLLPDAEQLEKYHLINPAITDWIIEATTKEQQFRHESYYSKLRVFEKIEGYQQKRFNLAMTLAFLIAIVGMVGSFFVIYLGHIITGSIFGGLTLVTVIGLFIPKKKNNEK